MNEVDVKDLIPFHEILPGVVHFPKIWIREFQSVKLAKIRIVHIYIIFDTQYKYLPYSYSCGYFVPVPQTGGSS